jgi:tetratricopeptide (TPR) repeat protein
MVRAFLLLASFLASNSIAVAASVAVDPPKKEPAASSAQAEDNAGGSAFGDDLESAAKDSAKKAPEAPSNDESTPPPKTAENAAPKAPPPEAPLDPKAEPAKLAIREAVIRGDMPAVDRLVGKAARQFPNDPELRVAEDYMQLHRHDVRAKAIAAMLTMESSRLFGHQWLPGRTDSDEGWDISIDPVGGRGTKSFVGALSAPVKRALVKGYALLDRGESAQADKLLTGVLRRHGDSPELYYARVMAREMAGDLKGADGDSLRAVTLSHETAVALSQRSGLMIAMGRREEAYSWAERTLAADPRNADALAIRGRVLWKDRQRPDLAIEDLKQAAEADPEEYAELYTLGVRLYRRQQALNDLDKGDYRQAFKDAELMLASDPKNPDAHMILGRVFMKMGNAEGTIKETTLALKSDPRSEKALFYRSVAMETLGARTEALADMKRVAALNPAKYQPLYDRLLQAQREDRGPIWRRDVGTDLAASR